MSPVHLVPTHRRLPLSSRDNLAIYAGYFPSSDTVDLEEREFFDADGVKPADASDHVGLFLALVTMGCIICFGAIAIVVGLYLGVLS